jgi:hypothetical protein
MRLEPSAIRRMLIVAALVVLSVGLFIAIAVMDPTFCHGTPSPAGTIDDVCWQDRWRVAVGFGSTFLAILLALMSIPDHGRSVSTPGRSELSTGAGNTSV